LTRVFGEFGSWVVLVIVMISFLSATLSLQAAASRLMYSYARDNMIAGSKRLSKISERHRVPAFALTVAGIVPSLLVLVAFISTDTLTKIVSFATVGIYVGFQMVVLAALRARLKGWKPAGPFTMGRWGLAVNVAALVYGIAAILVMAWPRTPDVPLFDNYIVSISMLIVIAAGVIYMMISRHAERSTAPFDDAIPSADYSRLP
jgi:amino acid transporter